MKENSEKVNKKTPIKIGLVDWILIMMFCSIVALTAIYFIVH